MKINLIDESDLFKTPDPPAPTDPEPIKPKPVPKGAGDPPVRRNNLGIVVIGVIVLVIIVAVVLYIYGKKKEG